jgi:hypothetical protein
LKVSARRHGDDLGDLRHVLERGDPGQHVLAGGGGGRQQVGVVAGQFRDQRRGGLGQQVGVGGVVGHAYLGHAIELGGGLGDGADAFTDDQHMDLAAVVPGNLLGGRDHVGGGAGQGAVVMFREYQDAHAIRSFRFIVVKAPWLRS